jgi:hypothetical protein
VVLAVPSWALQAARIGSRASSEIAKRVFI